MEIKNDEQLKVYNQLIDTGSLEDKLEIESIDMGWMNFSGDMDPEFYIDIIKTVVNFPRECHFPICFWKKTLLRS